MAITATVAGGVGATMGIGIAPGTDVTPTTTTRTTAATTPLTHRRSPFLLAAVVTGVGIAAGVAVTDSMVDAVVGSSQSASGTPVTWWVPLLSMSSAVFVLECGVRLIEPSGGQF